MPVFLTCETVSSSTSTLVMIPKMSSKFAVLHERGALEFRVVGHDKDLPGIGDDFFLHLAVDLAGDAYGLPGNVNRRAAQKGDVERK